MTYQSDPTSHLRDISHLQNEIDGLSFLSYGVVVSTEGAFFFHCDHVEAGERLVNIDLNVEIARIIDAADKGAGRWDDATETSHVNVGDRVWMLRLTSDEASVPTDWWRLAVDEEVFIGVLEALHALAVGNTRWGVKGMPEI